jgi:magnesium chelatase family protein
VKGAVLNGIDATLVDVEVDLANGLPVFTIVGLPDASVSEARDRVRAAVQHAGFRFPMQRITVNLAPSDLRKQGPGLDLAIALGLLVAVDSVPQSGLDGRLFVGELALGGGVRAVRGALACAETARHAGLREVVCPAPNAAEAALAGLPALPVADLRDAVEAARGRPPPPVTANPMSMLAHPGDAAFDLATIRDQERAKRAMEIAAAGGHNIVMTGPPGAGKTLLARALPGILPPLTVDEALEVTRIHSAAGLLPVGEALVRSRPFRAPHHGISVAGMVGGGSSFIRPGEVCLAHRGVLFMDELPEFPRSCLESLRQPIEDGVVTVVRAKAAVTFPARFMLVAAMNPCPCGHAGSDVPCRCTPHARDAYRQRLSGPLLDRIDLHVRVPRVETDRLLGDDAGERSSVVRARVERARTEGAGRGRRWRARCNAELSPGVVRRACDLSDEASSALARASRRHRLSARAVHRLLRVARTIADLESAVRVEAEHVLEAVSYRVDEGGAAEEEAS